MNVQWTLRCTLALLLAMAAAVAVGLLAWGPIQPDSHGYADTRTVGGIVGVPNAFAALTSALAALAGVGALRRSHWPTELKRPWRLFFATAGSSSLIAALHHLQPDRVSYLLAQLLLAATFTFAVCAFLAERVHPRFGSRSMCAIASLLAVSAGLWGLAAEWWAGTADVRPVLLLQTLPLLLAPAGALTLPGSFTKTTDWLLILSLLGCSKLLEAADAHVLSATGWISGHSLMHVALGALALWLAYRAVAAQPLDAGGVRAAAAGSSRRYVSSASTFGR